MYAGHFDFAHPLHWTVPALYTPDECAALIAEPNEHAWLPATVNRSRGREVDARVRNNAVAVLRDPALAADAFARVRPHVPTRMSTEIASRRVDLTVHGVHQPMRIYRYDPGQFFGVHEDQSYFGADGSQSLLTFMVYLNDDFDGGDTEFLIARQRDEDTPRSHPRPEGAGGEDAGVRVRPTTGMALLFQHRVLHAGCSVLRGTKYVLRSDILYIA
ncbi:MAG: 2OG-Fe(II) oxygenase [Polyangiaceae bacterium]